MNTFDLTGLCDPAAFTNPIIIKEPRFSTEGRVRGHTRARLWTARLHPSTAADCFKKWTPADSSSRAVTRRLATFETEGKAGKKQNPLEDRQTKNDCYFLECSISMKHMLSYNFRKTKEKITLPFTMSVTSSENGQ